MALAFGRECRHIISNYCHTNAFICAPSDTARYDDINSQAEVVGHIQAEAGPAAGIPGEAGPEADRSLAAADRSLGLEGHHSLGAAGPGVADHNLEGHQSLGVAGPAAAAYQAEAGRSLLGQAVLGERHSSLGGAGPEGAAACRAARSLAADPAEGNLEEGNRQQDHHTQRSSA